MLLNNNRQYKLGRIKSLIYWNLVQTAFFDVREYCYQSVQQNTMELISR